MNREPEIFDNTNSESENPIAETDYLLTISGMKEKLIEGLQTPLEDCLDESQVDW